MKTLKEMCEKYPREVDTKPRHQRRFRNSSFTGPIDIVDFTENEAEFRAIMREHKLKAVYRGPRFTNRDSNNGKPSMTMRCDATYVLIYAK